MSWHLTMYRSRNVQIVSDFGAREDPGVRAAGVAHTKLLAKLCSGLNKPNMQTVLPSTSVASLLYDLPLSKLRGLGGQFGKQVQERLAINSAGAHLP